MQFDFPRRLSLVSATWALLAVVVAGVLSADKSAAQQPAIELVQQGARGRVALNVEPDAARIGQRVTVSARGLRPDERLTVLGGRTPSSLRRIETVRADERGRVQLRVPVPDWARPGRNFLFALQTRRDGRIVALSRPVRVLGRSDGPAGDALSVVGTLARPNATCPRLIADNGRLYTLAGDLDGFRFGERVIVTGRVAEVSTCQQGTTIAIRRIEEAD